MAKSQSSTRDSGSKSSTTSDGSTFSFSDPTLRAAYDRVKARLDAIPPERLQVINIDVLAAASAAARVVKTLGSVVIPSGVTLPGFDQAHFDDLVTLGDALAYTHVSYLASSSPKSGVDAIVADVTQTREILLGDATTLSRHGIVDGQRLADLQGAVGYRNVASDVLVLVQILRQNEEAVLRHSAIAPGYLDSAELRARELLAIVDEREHARPVPTDVVDARVRAFTAYVEAYDALRRAVSYLRWNEGDADAIIPSLYAGKRRKPDGMPDPTPDPTPGPAPTPSPVTPAAAVPAGHPGGDPFAGTSK